MAPAFVSIAAAAAQRSARAALVAQHGLLHLQTPTTTTTTMRMMMSTTTATTTLPTHRIPSSHLHSSPPSASSIAPQSPASPLINDTESRIAAFYARTGIPAFDDSNILIDALTHKSFKLHRNENSKGRYFQLGGSVFHLYATEYVLAKFPEMPVETVQNIVRAYMSPKVLSQVGQSFGVQLLMRWKETKGTDLVETPKEGESVGEASVRAWVTQSLLGAIYQYKGPAFTRRFIHSYFLSRVVDVDAHLSLYVKMNTPRLLLVHLCKRFNRSTPVARLIKETGRLSNNAVFIVGMYSGIDKIGEGYGSSLKMAETRAIKDALLKHYSKEVNEIELPSDLDSGAEESLSFFEIMPADTESKLDMQM